MRTRARKREWRESREDENRKENHKMRREIG